MLDKGGNVRRLSSLLIALALATTVALCANVADAVSVNPANRFNYQAGIPGPVHLPSETLAKNGGFEPPEAESVQLYETLGPSDSAKLGGGWIISNGSIDLVGPDSAQAAEGVQFVDLNGNDASGPGAIQQDIVTMPGHEYRLDFQLAGNPNGDPTVKTLTATFGEVSHDFSFDTTGHTNDNLGWAAESMLAVSCSPSMRVTISSTTSGQRGPNVDAFSVVDLGSAPSDTCPGMANHPPVAQNQIVSTSEGMAKALTLMATDADNDQLTYSVISGPSHGSLSGTPPNLSYTPTPGYSGP